MSRGTRIKKTQFLSEEECTLIHAGSCRLLSELGVKVESDEAIRLFKDGGADVKDGRVTVPQSMVEQAVQQTAKKIELGASDPENKLTIDVNVDSPAVHFGTGGQALYVLHQTKDGSFTRKPAVTQDLIDIIRICEKLDNVDFITRPVEPDVAENEMDMEKTRIFIENTTKHINLANLVKIEKLPEILTAIEDPSRISFIASLTVSPMNLVSPTIEKYMKMVEHGLPVAISSCPQAGATAPLSEVGELIQVNAEILSAVVLANLIKSGAKVFYRAIPITSDLFSDGSPRWCQPESIRRVAMVTDLTYYYGIPCCGTAAVSDEKEPNAQTVAEKTLSWVFEAASGAQYINSALGMLEQVLTVCPEQYIIDDKVISHVKKLLTESPDYDISDVAQTAVTDALSMFNAPVTNELQDDLSNRIEFILNGQEEYSSETVDAQVELISKAVTSGRSSTKFMKAARSGLRKGWLYQGQRAEGALDFKEVNEIKNRILVS